MISHRLSKPAELSVHALYSKIRAWNYDIDVIIKYMYNTKNEQKLLLPSWHSEVP